MKKFTSLILALTIVITSYYCVFAESSFVVSLQTAKTLTYDNNNYYSMADVVGQGQDFYVFFCINEPESLYGYQFKLNYDKNLVEPIKDNGAGAFIPVANNEAAVKFDSLFTLPYTEKYNVCNTETGEISYFVSLVGNSAAFPTKSELPYYRLASMHFRAKETVDCQTTFSLEIDRFKDRYAVALFRKDGGKIGYFANTTKKITIHNFKPTVPFPPFATYEYKNNKWYLTLNKENDSTVAIWYKTTFDGDFTLYDGEIPLDPSTIVYAYTRRTGITSTSDSTTITSTTDSATIVFAAPTVSANPPPGIYDTKPVDGIALYSVPSGYDVYYTTDLNPDITNLTKYTAPIPFPANTSEFTIKTILGKDGNIIGTSFKTLDYSIRPSKPTANPNGGTHILSVAIDLDASDECDIYYTLDESEPTTGSTKYNGSPIIISSTSTVTKTLRAIAVKDNRPSEEFETKYTIVPQPSGGGGGGGGTVYKYITIEKILSDLKYKVVDGKAVYDVPKVEGDATGDYVINSDATQDKIDVNFTLQHVVDGAKGLKNFIIKTKTDTFILPFKNTEYPLALAAGKDINPLDIPVTLEYSREVGTSPLIENAGLTKGSKFYSYKLTAYINKVPLVIKYLDGYAQYIIEKPVIPDGKIPLGVAMNGNIIQTPLIIDKAVAGKESIILRTLSDHPICVAFGDKRTYADIAGGWYQDSIERLATMRIVNGRPEGFAPNSLITRSELAAMISRAIGAVMKDNTETTFNDLDKTNWSYYEANNAQKWKLISGYPDSTFKPEQEITRLETIQIIANALGYTNNDAFVNTTEAGKYLSGITDANDIESWAVPSVVMIIKYGLIKGYEDGTIKPNNNITRAEAATLISRLLTNFKLIN